MSENKDAPIEVKAPEYSDAFLAFLKDNEQRIKDVSENFSIYQINASKIGIAEAKRRVTAWLGNFDKIGFTNFNIALFLLEQFVFVSSGEIINKLSLIAKKEKLLEEKMVDTYITHLGEDTESSYRLTSHFNVTPNFCSELPKLLDSIDSGAKIKILFFDDFLNSGGQIRTIFYALLNKPLPEGEIDDEWSERTKLNPEQIAKLLNCEIHIFYYLAFDEGIEKSAKIINDELKLSVKFHKHSVANLNNGAFGDQGDQENIIYGASGRIATDCSFRSKKYADLSDFYKVLKEVGKQLLVKNEPHWEEEKHESRCLGYGNICRLISTDYNIPSITITALWHNGEITIDGKKIFWNELLPRRKKVLKLKKDNGVSEPHVGTEENVTETVNTNAEVVNVNIEEKIIQEIILTSTVIVDEEQIEPLKFMIKKFRSLDDAIRVEIGQSLEVYTAEMQNLPPDERDKEMFVEINKRNLVRQLWEKLKELKV